ncbi:MAG: caspase family protein [Egibacteraceae bacterium]
MYALLVGIDEYPDPRHRLEGCVNDVEAMEAWLRARASGEGIELDVRTLCNQQAGRDAVIGGFREHLCGAGADDVALFYYSGHGSQEPSQPEFWHMESDRVDETLVCWDSRAEGGCDLADKELAALIGEVATRDPYVLVVLDSCHSGSGTRGEMLQTRVRRLAPARQPRPRESYLFDLNALAPVQAGGSGGASGWRLLPQGRHVLLAACAEAQEAREIGVGGVTRGAFSHCLHEVLAQTDRRLTYWDVISRVRGLISGRVAAQIPQIEAFDTADFDQPFLGGAIAERRPLTVRHDPHQGWVLDAGAVHAIPGPEGGETTRLALFAEDADVGQARRLGAAVVQDVEMAYSRVKIVGADGLRLSDRFKAVVTSLPMPPVAVRLEGDAEGIELVQAALAQRSPYVKQAWDHADYRVLAAGGEYLITRPADDRPLVEQVIGYTPEAAARLKQRLEHIGCWELTLKLDHPGSALPANAVEILLYRDDVEVQGGDVRLTYGPGSTHAERPAFTLLLRNNTDRRLYCAVLNLSEAYAVGEGGFGDWIEPGHTRSVKGGRPFRTSVPDSLWDRGVTERRDWLKLIVSTEQFDASRMHQGPLGAPRTQSRAARGGHRSRLEWLLDRVQSREIDEPDDDGYTDWTTQTLSIVTARPRAEVALRPGAGTQSLGAGVRVGPHPRLEASARLTTVPQVRGDVGALSPPILRENPAVAQPLQLTRSRGQDPGLSVLEISGIIDHTVVTAEEPLLVDLAVDLGEDEHILPVAFDGEFFLPLGSARRGLGVTTVAIQRLPTPVSEGRKSLTGSVRILFHKLVAKRLGRTFQYPILTVADLAADGATVRYEKNLAVVRQRVAEADDIVLCIHGIIGDTHGIAASVCRIRPSALVLAFDYENLNTPIDETARALRARLADVGIAPGNGKRLQVVAHSLGGLACRWLVEREGGNDLVSHLVLLGTPSGGSPWPAVQDWATAWLSIGLNGLATVAWPAEALGSLVRWLEQTNVTLEQMEPGSDLLTTLAGSPNPGIPYTLICGNTSLRHAATQPRPEDNLSLYQRLMRLVLQPVNTAANALLDLPFGGAPNDIAVSVDSMRSVGPTVGASVAEVKETACDHMTYFNVADSLDRLAAALDRADIVES